MKSIFWTSLKYFGIVAGSLATLYGVFCFFDGMKDDITDIKETQVEYQATADTILDIARTYDQRILANKRAVEGNANEVEVLRSSYVEYLKHDDGLTKEEFVDYMDPFLEYIKKNSSPTVQYNQTPLLENIGMSTGEPMKGKPLPNLLTL